MSTPLPVFRSLDEIKQANRDAGRYWFSLSTLRFFSSRPSSMVYPSTIHGGAFFVTSEKGPDGVRKYSVRWAHPDGNIDTVGAFQAYTSRNGAHGAAARYATTNEPLEVNP